MMSVIVMQMIINIKLKIFTKIYQRMRKLNLMFLINFTFYFSLSQTLNLSFSSFYFFFYFLSSTIYLPFFYIENSKMRDLLLHILVITKDQPHLEFVWPKKFTMNFLFAKFVWRPIKTQSV